jgi:antirestriction protein ArdC
MIIEQGGKTFYRPSTDEVYLPERSRFASDEAFYAVALRVLAHWTCGKVRLARDFALRFGSEAYAFEELIAEWERRSAVRISD